MLQPAEELALCVREVCSCCKYGGRVEVVDSCTCVLLDASCWTDAMAACVREVFAAGGGSSCGGVQISCRQSSTSLSGFCVAFTVPSCSSEKEGSGKRVSWLQGALLLAVVLAMAAGLYAYSLRDLHEIKEEL